MSNGIPLKVIAATFLVAFLACAQTPSAPPAAVSFDVASIKPAPPLDPVQIASGKLHIGVKTDAARVDMGFMSITALICTAYAVKPYQVTGPDWMTTQRFDIVAKMPEGSTKEQMPEMLKALLAERFKLTVHKEGKSHPVYALVVGKNGPKLKEAVPDPTASAEPAPLAKGEMSIGNGDEAMRIKPNSDGKGVSMSSAKTGAMKMTMGPDGNMRMEAAKVSMASFAELLSQLVGRPTVDETGIKGDYQIAMDLSPMDLMNAAQASGMMPAGAGMPRGGSDNASDPAGGSIMTAVQSLGLKLESRNVPVETIIVDHVEKTPTEN